MSIQTADYQPAEIEPKWQRFWAENATFAGHDPASGETPAPKFYVLDMFPYPSGAGLHIGHPEGYTATDALKRMKKAQGFNVLHPMGWDAFGLPTEQYAIKTGEPPAKVTRQNIARFKEQLAQIGLAYDWQREINTTDPGYFQWTQWIFTQLFKHGLAYVDEKPVWYCPELGTVLANEEVLNTPEGPRSERGSHPVERRPLRQWVLKITAYADKLLAGLDKLDWPDSTKRLQANWIGRSTGAEVDFELDGHAGKKLRVFTTRPDTLYGATYMVVAPEHPYLVEITTAEQRAAVEAYVEQAKNKSDLERAELSKEKTGVDTGARAINPINGEKIPVWVADYVLMSYGTGAIMAVPAHDERDYEFAKEFGLEIIQVVAPEGMAHEGFEEHRGAHDDCGTGWVIQGFETHEETTTFFATQEAFSEKGIAVNSGPYDGLPTDEAKAKIIAELAEKKLGQEAVNYKLRDWLFSRQRYWGEPFPILWLRPADYERLKAIGKSELLGGLPLKPVTSLIDGEEHCAVSLPTRDLPLTLPEVESYQPTGTGESPLAKAHEWTQVWVNLITGETVSRICEEHGAERQVECPGAEWVAAQRETNTMPQWAGSCWYYLRYLDPKNPDALVDPAKERYWQGPDLYVGGAEHAVLHLLYARFWHLFLHDIGVLETPEPFTKLFHQGIILGEDGEKMSKSRGNVVNPETVIEQHGADAMRLYLMFLGPLEAMKPWNTDGIQGIDRFLKKVWRTLLNENGDPSPKLGEAEDDADTARVLHETIKKVTADYEKLSFNTAISQLMIAINQFAKTDALNLASAKAFLQLLAPLAPHLAEELWARLGGAPSIANASWPQHDESKLAQDTVKLMVQINGKLRGDLHVAKDMPKDDVLAAAKALDKVAPHLDGKTLVKEIYVPGRIVNLVVK